MNDYDQEYSNHRIEGRRSIKNPNYSGPYNTMGKSNNRGSKSGGLKITKTNKTLSKDVDTADLSNFLSFNQEVFKSHEKPSNFMKPKPLEEDSEESSFGKESGSTSLKEGYQNLQPEEKEPENNDLNMSVIICIVIVLFGFCSSVFYVNEDKTNNFNLTNEVREMAKTYPEFSKAFWLHLEIGLMDVKRYSKPTVFTLAYAGNDQRSSIIAKQMGGIAARYLGKSKEHGQPLLLESKDLDFADHGEVVSRFSEDLKRRHSMVVNNLESVPGMTAQGFRYLCDEYSPLVERAAIFLTVNLKNCENFNMENFVKGPDQSTTGLVEQCLISKWSKDLHSTIWQPLLARVVNVVLKIVP